LLATYQSTVAEPAPRRPATRPESNPISATHGASVMMPSFPDHENAIMTAHVARIPATPMDVTK